MDVKACYRVLSARAFSLKVEQGAFSFFEKEKKKKKKKKSKSAKAEKKREGALKAMPENVFFFQSVSHIREKTISFSHCKNKSTSF